MWRGKGGGFKCHLHNSSTVTQASNVAETGSSAGSLVAVLHSPPTHYVAEGPRGAWGGAGEGRGVGGYGGGVRG